MLVRLIINCIFLIVIAGCVNNQNDERELKKLNVSANSVVVQYDYIKFVFDVDRKDTWKWFEETTRTGVLEYQWSAGFQLKNNHYRAAFNLFKYPDTKPSSGSFEELIDAGQVNLWKVELGEPESATSRLAVITGAGTLVRGAEIVASTENNRLVLLLKEPSIVEEFVSLKPDSVSYSTKTPRTNFESVKLPVTYHTSDFEF